MECSNFVADRRRVWLHLINPDRPSIIINILIIIIIIIIPINFYLAMNNTVAGGGKHSERWQRETEVTKKYNVDAHQRTTTSVVLNIVLL